MKQAVIVSTARTRLAKSYRGAFNETHGATMAGHVIEHAVARAGITPDLLEDAFLGCGYPEGWTGSNIARQAVIRAGYEFDVPVRFATDAIRTSMASFNAGEVPDVPVIEVRL